MSALPKEQQENLVVELYNDAKYRKPDGGMNWKAAIADRPELMDRLGIDRNTSKGGMQQLYQFANKLRMQGLLPNRKGFRVKNRVKKERTPRREKAMTIPKSPVPVKAPVPERYLNNCPNCGEPLSEWHDIAHARAAIQAAGLTINDVLTFLPAAIKALKHN